MAKIEDVCASKIDTLSAAYNGKIDYIDISAVDNREKKITQTAIVLAKDAPSRAKQLVEHGDVIVSLVRPNLNAVAIIEEQSQNLQVASTGYCVLRCNQMIYNRYLFYFCQSETFVNSMTAQATGASYPAVSNSIVKNCEIPLPERNKQKEIADILDKVIGLISLRKQQLAKLDELVKAQFVEMFGDPVRNEKGWNTYALAEMCDGIGDGLHGTPEYDENGEYPFINGNNLIDGVIQINASTKKVNKKTYEKHYIKISQNAILLSINGTLGKIAFYNGEQVMLGKSACYCNLKDEVNRIFVYKIMKTDAFAGYLEDNSTKSTIKNVGLKAIREYRLIAPPLSLQNQFAVFAEYVDQQKQTVQQSLEKLELMKKALMQEYFG